jgi:hypothetical protein
MPPVTISEIVVAGDPELWGSFGFALDHNRLQLGGVWMRFAGKQKGSGILSWSLRELTHDQLGGLSTTRSTSEPPGDPPVHPNGVLGLDHVVAFSTSLGDSVEALVNAGLDLRRIREQPTPAGAPRQAFFRLGGEILEVVQGPQNGEPTGLRFWGLALRSEDLERTAASFSPHCSEIRPAVQTGRFISSVRRSAGLAVPLALMSQ